MTLPRISTRTLYLLALFQLAAGPLVIAIVFAFCNATVHEAPKQGIAKAMVKAWHSDAVQDVLQVAADQSADGAKAPVPTTSKAKAKIIAVAWQRITFKPNDNVEANKPARVRSWTPSWPQAPPGTPPRVG